MIKLIRNKNKGPITKNILTEERLNVSNKGKLLFICKKKMEPKCPSLSASVPLKAMHDRKTQLIYTTWKDLKGLTVLREKNLQLLHTCNSFTKHS